MSTDFSGSRPAGTQPSSSRRVGIRRVGVLTGGGDCPGLNAVLRSITKGALRRGVEVVGIEDGFLGLIEDRMRPLDYAAVSNVLTLGGTILGSSNRANPTRFQVGENPDGTPKFADVSARCLEHASKAGLDALFVVGGDGTMACAEPMVEGGLPCIGLPKTIDNDILGTELTFGFQTAVATATDALDRVHTTAASHHRAITVELMGRNAGWLGLHAGIASGSDVILLPEIPFDLATVGEFCERRARRGKRFTVLCVSEGARLSDGSQVVAATDPGSPDPIRLGGVGRAVAEWIDRETTVDARSVVLGHVQRGGGPVAADRVLGTELGAHGLECLLAGNTNRMVVVRGGRVCDVPISEAIGGQRLVSAKDPLIAAARSVYTCFGDEVGPRP